ncbi:hypothetical protein [Pseudoxanthomonas sp.]|uniref:hypothetical protein n=1 Tax=Pseudoxanthomonas sp. TaxID=1871049 RepID=UPI00262047C1|nr:hypothetical protein [Pseudoxanthomonas sp.]WDS37479.1 MAG: hypothetical protein O8I58_06295 [Pseudoxanthomonas sp.]
MTRHLPARAGQRAVILVLLAALLVATRSHLPALLTHLGPIPDASWAVFFMAGFYLRGWSRWAFPLFMALAMGVDYLVITGQGIDFFSHYCVSAAYWCLVPAYLVLWMGGSLTARLSQQLSDNRTLVAAAAALVASVALCHLVSQGSFYWVSDSVPQPTLAGWWENYSDWFLPFLRSTAIYVGLGVIVHVAVLQVVRLARPQDRRAG